MIHRNKGATRHPQCCNGTNGNGKEEEACYHSVQSILSSHLLSRNVKVKIYKTIILPVVLYGCETWSLTLRVFENRVLRILTDVG
jgi:hypothetical protein